jgi:DNA polymerase-3 subunit epsilon/ATP-dependent DNA helicase DinG
MNQINKTGNTYISLDLETTGLNANSESIIEIGAVKFIENSVIDEYQTFINPHRPIPNFIQHLTGISDSDVQFAPTMPQILPELRDFLGDTPIIGQNIQFDLKFLDNNNLNISPISYDTWDLASIFFPKLPEYSLSYLGQYFEIANQSPHRALEDAKATHQVFIKLINHIRHCDHKSLEYIINLCYKTNWDLGKLLQHCLESSTNIVQPKVNVRKNTTTVHQSLLNSDIEEVDYLTIMEQFLNPDSFKKYWPGEFEYRPEQMIMLEKVFDAIKSKEHLIIEAGTGVGKSMAYLLPSIIHAINNKKRVVISTNTINLQEQLVNKDLPELINMLVTMSIIPENSIKFSLLKGKNNYLCMKRFEYMSDNQTLTKDEARMLSKISLWMQNSDSGDRSEINLSNRDQINWSKMSAGEKTWCPNLKNDEFCFLGSAREKAETSDILVVNHALLLSDLRMGGTLIPQYETLIIDEAHNLEDEATRQFQFEVSGNQLNPIVDNQLKIADLIKASSSNLTINKLVRDPILERINELERSVDTLTSTWVILWELLNAEFISASNSGDNYQTILQGDVRVTPSWFNILETWDNFQTITQTNIAALRGLCNLIDSLDVGLPNKSHLVIELNHEIENIENLNTKLTDILKDPDENSVQWVSTDRNKTEVQLHSAPIDVGDFLSQSLFEEKDSVICTSATLTTYGSFNHIKARLGIPENCSEDQLGSPYDYNNSGLLLLPKDMPAPSHEAYITEIARTIISLSVKTNGRTVVLFTSYSALRSVAALIRDELRDKGIPVLAQGLDGSPQQLIRRFNQNPNGVILGTNSFWEGVDFARETLKLLIITRLPFQVPTDPIVQARSSRYENSFQEYSVPQAILKFRQGIGRLIRSTEDRGAVVILDNRIVARSYGKTFVSSLPDFNTQICELQSAPKLVEEWLS